jgi:transglutaminase-like putative cysteine protease
MNAALLFRRAAIVLVLVSVAAFAASQRSGWVLVAGGVLAVAAARLTDGPRRRALPAFVLRIGVIALILWGGMDFMRQPTPDQAPRVVGYVVLGALLLKLWDRKEPSDWRQVIALSIVLVVASALASGDFLVGVLVIGYAMATIVTTMLYHLHAGAERAVADRRAAAVRAGALPPMEAPHGSAPVRHLRRLAGVGIVMGVALSTMVFVMFPRDSVLGGGQGGARQSGFRPDISLWSGGRVSLSSRIAMTVTLLDPRGAPGALVLPLRLRGAVLDRYQPGEAQWRAEALRGGGRTYQTGPGAGFQWFAGEGREERSNVWTEIIEMRSLASEHVFTAWLPLAMACDEPRSFTLDPRNAQVSETYSGISGRPRTYSFRMQAFPSAAVSRAVAGGQPPAVPDFPVPQVRAIAQRILEESSLADLPDEAAIARDPQERWIRNRRIAAMLQDYLSSPRFRYTTDLSDFRRTGNEDPNVLFLDRYRFGHCEYFASAMVALCRSLGIEARVVTGFMATEYDSVSDRYVIRESGAHAWAEVRTGEWQWGTFDPSPIAEVLAIQQANRTWMDSFRWILDPIEFAWNSRFASFDSRAQAELVDRVGAGTRGIGEWASERAKELVDAANRWFRLGSAGTLWLALVGVTLAIAAVAAWVVGRRLRRVGEELGAGGESLVDRLALGRDAAFYLDSLDVLRRAGAGKPRGRTPRVHAEDLRTRNPAAGEAFSAIVGLFYEIRYGGRACSRAERVAADAMVDRLRSALGRGYTS